jgi:TonB family protein
VAIAARHPQTPEIAQAPFAELDVIDPGPDSSPPFPIEMPTPPPLAPIERPDFIDAQESPPRLISQQHPVPIRPPGIPKLGVAGNPKAYAVNAPRPEYPYEARSRHLMGSGVAVITVDPVNGSVVGARMELSIDSAILDNSALSAFKRWRFKPGTVSIVRIPITYNLAGPSY